MTATIRYLRHAVLGLVKHPPRARRRRSGRGPMRDEKYKAWIRSLLCCACSTEIGVEAAHTGSDGGTGLKASDTSCVPLCVDCHRTGERAYHRLGRPEFERVWGLDLAGLVARLNRVYFVGGRHSE